jgi:hypothetical protein
MMAIDAIEEIDPATLTEADAAAAYYANLGRFATSRGLSRQNLTTCDSFSPPRRENGRTRLARRAACC